MAFQKLLKLPRGQTRPLGVEHQLLQIDFPLPQRHVLFLALRKSLVASFEPYAPLKAFQAASSGPKRALTWPKIAVFEGKNQENQ